MKSTNGRYTAIHRVLVIDNRSFRLIVVSEDDNMMEVYEKRQMTARVQSDLATAVQWN